MYTLFTDSPLTDFHRHDAASETRRQEILTRRPACCACGEQIAEEYCYKYNGDYYCENCSDNLVEQVFNDCWTRTPEDEEW